MTEFADDGVFKLFDCLEIAGIDVFIEEVPEEVQGTDIVWEQNALGRLFWLIWALIETVACKHNLSY